jgi:hypothetical protein
MNKDLIKKLKSDIAQFKLKNNKRIAELEEDLRIANQKAPIIKFSDIVFPTPLKVHGEIDVKNLPSDQKVHGAVEINGLKEALADTQHIRPKWYKEPKEKIKVEIVKQLKSEKPTWLDNTIGSTLELVTTLLSSLASKTLDAQVKFWSRLWNSGLNVRLEHGDPQKPQFVVMLDPHSGKAMGGADFAGGGRSMAVMSSRTGGGVGGLPIIYNVPMPTGATEYSICLPNDTKKILIKLREIGYDLQLAWNAGESGSNYVTVPAGSTKDISGVNLSDKTLYFQCSEANQVAEIEIFI